MSALQKLIILEKSTEKIGFDWPNIETIIEQIISECKEIQETIKLNEGQERLQEEIGDLIHAGISLCVFAKLDVEETIALVNQKFGARLAGVARLAQEQGYITLKGQSFDFILELWEQAKQLKMVEPPRREIEIRLLTVTDIPQIVDAFAKCNWAKPAITFEKYWAEQNNSERVMWVAFVGGDFAGYVTLKWDSLYDPFRQKSIPEIKDLNVLPAFQCLGIGSQLLGIAEAAAKERSATVGIGVGLLEGYGQAQRLYIDRGYFPDGLGVTYNYEPVRFGTPICLDDELVLWLTKDLKGL